MVCLQASLASMTSATMLSSTGPRTTRAAKELWTDVRPPPLPPAPPRNAP